MDVLRPFPTFYFRVTLAGAAGGPDSSFAQVNGLDAEREVETVAEGGENRFAHRLPGRVRHRPLILRRGLLPAESPLRAWCVGVIQSDFAERIEPRQLDVDLLDPEGDPLVSWSVQRAWPLRMVMAPFDAADNAPAVETLEFAFARITRSDGAASGLSLGFG
jgi:phage tail-like protein